MNSIEIKFEVKRPRKIYKVMDYVIMLGVVMVAAVIIIFLPFVSKEENKATVQDSIAVAQARYEGLRKSAQEVTQNSAEDKEYQDNFNSLEDTILPVHEYLQSLNDFANHYQDGRYSYLSQSVSGNVIMLTVQDNGATNLVPEFKQALLDNTTFSYINDEGQDEEINLAWITRIEMSTAMSNNSISMEVYYGK